jgi:glutamine synthetase
MPDDQKTTDDQRRALIDSVAHNPTGRVKVAVADIEGVLRGKYVHASKFASLVDSGLGFNVFGCDIADQPYDDDWASGRMLGFPDANVRLDLATHRDVPWDDHVPFFLGDFWKADGQPHPLCPRQVLKRVLARARDMGYQVIAGTEFEFFNFLETPESWAQKKGARPRPMADANQGYSLVRANAHRDYFKALMEETSKFRVPIDSLHTETGPGVYEAAILFDDALEAADRGVLFKQSAKEIAARFGIMPSFMAKWHARYPGCSGHVHQSLLHDGRNVFHEENGPHGGMSPVFMSYVAGQLAYLAEFAPLFWPTVNSYKRLVPNVWAPVRFTWGVDNRTAMMRVLPGSKKAARVETRCPGADMNPYLGIAALVAAGLAGVEHKLELSVAPVTGDNVGGEGAVRAPRTLIETTRAFHASRLARDWLGTDFVDYFAATREFEWRQFLDAVTDWELRRYFELI